MAGPWVATSGYRAWAYRSVTSDALHIFEFQQPLATIFQSGPDQGCDGDHGEYPEHPRDRAPEQDIT